MLVLVVTENIYKHGTICNGIILGSRLIKICKILKKIITGVRDAVTKWYHKIIFSCIRKGNKQKKMYIAEH
jgi:hypothetical protein